VGNLDTEGHALATKVTLRHFIAPPNRMINHENIAHFERLDMIADKSKKSKRFFR
jgi:hypothetical protein